ncbi:hypothetical protein DUNSADRAFT_991 [Dunaliella salina]|uniref:DNA endonuclease activator Ctp1 C-terminal domain-containing protein n=1 Tax=Dunaliella salina TaxID=3046 RepID=A0ABQ7FY43_DUNSA|nr:hypothetical protein DUNSADRAFT_991 [Dunaliella salina]|eukprot:KAF5827285.1 hypothetical protein DUNSADRAFT_991 [Dunaliella salina]
MQRGSQVVQGPADKLGGIGAALMEEAASLGAGGAGTEGAKGNTSKRRKKPRTHMQAPEGGCDDTFFEGQGGGDGGEDGCGGGGWRGRKRGAGKGSEGGMERGGKRRPHADVDVWPKQDCTTKASTPVAKKLREQAERGKQRFMSCLEKQQQKEHQRQQQQMQRKQQQQQQQQQQHEQQEQERQQELQEGGRDGVPQGKPRKYNEVVRKKDKREALPGYTCHACCAFFRSLRPYGGPGGPQMPSCGHTLADAAHGSSLAEFQEGLIQENSKHRALFAPPQTPPGFWELGFPDDAARELAAEAAEEAAAAAAAAAEAVAAADAALAVVGSASAGRLIALTRPGDVQAAAREAGSPPATHQPLHVIACAEPLSL